MIIFYSFPYDEGARRIESRVGADYGPEQIRDALRSLAVYDDEVAESVVLLDLGEVPRELSFEKAHEHLYQWVAETFNQLPEAVVVLLGGSQDMAYSGFKALYDGAQAKTVGVVGIDRKLDVAEGGVHSRSSLRLVLEDEARKAKVVVFGASGSEASLQEEQFLLDHDAKILYKERDINRGKATLQQAIDHLGTPDYLIASLDVAAINSAWCLGVSDPCVVGGFDFREA